MLEASSSSFRPIRAFPTHGMKSHLARELPDDLLRSFVERDEARRLSRICQLAVAACRLALRDSGLEASDDGVGLGLVVGSEFGDLRSTEEFAGGYLKKGPIGLSPMIFPNTVMNAMAAAASIAVGGKGPSITLNQATVGGDLAVARAFGMVASGRMTAVLAGGVDEISPLLYRMLSEMNAISPMAGGAEGCRPFDRSHNGAIRGEGSTFVLLEPLEDALGHGANIYAEIRGAAWGNSPTGSNRHRSNGHSQVITHALAQAQITEEEIGWAYLSGNGDPLLDDYQLDRLTAAFGSHAPRFTSLTPWAGDHAGLGGIRAAAAAWTASTRRLIPLSTLSDPIRSGCAFATGSRSVEVDGAGLVHGVARGGTEVALVISPFLADR
jgi:3-oxoacyl-(acyl-carrier-protein) synthase